MKRQPTITEVLKDIPRLGAYWHANASGTPIALTISGKAVVAALEGAGYTTAKILAVLGLKLTEQQFAYLRAQPSTSDPGVHVRAKERATALAEGRWRPEMIRGRF